MTLPSVVSGQTETFQKDDANATSFEVTIPSGLTNGNVLLVVFVCDGNRTIDLTTGGDLDFQLANTQEGSVTIRAGFKRVDGTEGSAVTVTTSGSERACAVAYEIQDVEPFDGFQSLEQETATGESNTPDPPVDAHADRPRLMVAVVGVDRDKTIDSFPANMTAGSVQLNVNGGGANSCSIGSDTHQTSGSNFNPDTFGISASEGWAALTIAVVGPVIEPNAFRLYDDGTESGSSPKAAQDVNIELDSTGDAQFHLRYRFQNNTNVSMSTLDDYRLEVSKNGGSFATVTASSSNVQSDTASGLTDGAATTNRATDGIADGTGSFNAGEQEETNGVIEDLRILFADFTEVVWGCKLIDADVSDTDTLDFRVAYASGGGGFGDPGMLNSVTPRITVSVAPGPNQTLTATATGVASVQLAVAKTLATSAVANAALNTKCFISLSDTAVGVATISTLRTAFVTATAIATGVVNLARKSRIGLSNTAIGVAALARKSKIVLSNTATGIADITVTAITALTEIALAATATVVAALQLKTKKTLASTAAGLAVLTTSSTFVLALTATAAGIATLAKKAKLGLSDTAAGIAALARKARLGLSVSATGVVDLARKVKIALGNTASGVVAVVVNALAGATLLTLTATATAIAALQITVKKTLGAVSVGIATLDPIATFRVLLANVGTGIATLRKVATFRRAFAAVATGVVALGKKPKLGLAVTAVGIASINRTVFKTLRSTAEGVATVILATAILVALAAVAVVIPALALKVKRGLRATGAGVANIQRFVRKTLRSVAIGVAVLNDEVPKPPSRLQRVLIGFFGGPGGGPGR